MYRRHLGQDEQLSQVLVFFAMTLVFGFLISWKLVGVDTYDAEMIVYLSLGGLSFLLMITSIVLFLIGKRHPFLDVEVNLDKQVIRFFYGKVSIPIDKISLISFNTRHRQVRLVVKWFTIGFPIDELVDNEGVALSEDQLNDVAPNAVVAEPKALYNYSMLVSGVFVGLFIAYIVGYGKGQVPLFNWRYIETYWIMILVVVLSGIAYASNYWRLSRIITKKDSNEDTTE